MPLYNTFNNLTNDHLFTLRHFSRPPKNLDYAIHSQGDGSGYLFRAKVIDYDDQDITLENNGQTEVRARIDTWIEM